MERLTIKEKQILQEIKQHVAFGAPIEILNYKQDYVGIQYSKANGYYMLAGDIYVTYDGGSTGKSVKDFRFLLRPLSQITEEIEHKGERFVPIERIQELFNLPEQSSYLLADTVKSLSDFFFTRDLTDVFRFETVVSINSKLHEWHFDVFGLIDRGLALTIDGKEVETITCGYCDSEFSKGTGGNYGEYGEVCINCYEGLS